MHFGAIYLRVQEHHSWEFLAYASEWLTYAVKSKGNDGLTLYLNDSAKNSMVRCVLGGGGAVWSKVTRGLLCEVQGCCMFYAKHELF